MNVRPRRRPRPVVRVGTVLAFAGALVSSTPSMSAGTNTSREASAGRAPTDPAHASATSPSPGESAAGPDASASSDLLVVLDPDGHGYLAQHTLSSEGALIVLALPGSVEADHVRFSGPERALFADAQRRRPGWLSLWSGGAFARYRHRYADAAVTEENGERSLLVPSVPPRLTVEDGVLARSSITWVLPDGFELVSVGKVGLDGTASRRVAPETLDADDVAPDGIASDERARRSIVSPRGSWHREGRGVRFEQRGAVPLELVLRYRRTPPDPDSIDCLEVDPADDDACSPDRDGDGVPDRRDVCLPEGTATDVDAFGCTRGGTDGVLVLDGIGFRGRQSYLDIDARRLLDRLARALARLDDDSVHEIAAHAAGPAGRDRRLAAERARAIRHYLMLRGIGPNRLRAVGLGGEGSARTGADPAGGGTERRIELRRLQTAQ